MNDDGDRTQDTDRREKIVEGTEETGDGGATGDTSAGVSTAVDAKTVEHVASLARVDVDEGDRERFAAQFADILAYFETLDEVPSVESDPELTNVMRPDEVVESLDQDEALRNAPETEEGYFKGPRVS